MFLEADAVKEVRPARELRARKLCPFVAQIDNRTLLTGSGDLVRVFRFTGGISPDTSTNEEKDGAWDTLHAFVRRIVTEYPDLMLFGYLDRRSRYEPFREEPPLEGWGRVVQEALYKKSCELYRTNTYHLVVVLPSKPISNRMRLTRELWNDFGELLTGKSNHARSGEIKEYLASTIGRGLDRLDGVTKMIESLLKKFAPKCLESYNRNGVEYSGIQEFFAMHLRGYPSPVPRYGFGMETIAERMCTTRVSFGDKNGHYRTPVTKDERFFAILLIENVQGKREGDISFTQPGLFDELLSAGWEGTMVHMFQGIGPTASQQRVVKLRAFALNDVEADLEADGDELVGKGNLTDRVASGELVVGCSTSTLLITGRTPDELDEHVANAIAALNSAGITAVRESFALETGFRSLFPGKHVWHPMLGHNTSEFFVDSFSCHVRAIGRPKGHHWGQALTRVSTRGGGVCHVSIHQRGSAKPPLGHTLIVGTSGSGKTTWLHRLLTHASRFGARGKKTRIVCFDHKKGMAPFVWRMGGSYIDFRPNHPTGINPFQLRLSGDRETFARRLVQTCAQIGFERLTTQQVERLDSAVSHVCTQLPFSEQCLKAVLDFLSGDSNEIRDLRRRIARYVGNGEYAWLLGATTNTLDLAEGINGFNMSEVFREEAVSVPLMMVLFELIERTFDGSTPGVIAIDEFQFLLSQHLFTTKVEDWLESMRKRDCAVIMSTVSPHKIAGNKVAETVAMLTRTRFMFRVQDPNPDTYGNWFGCSEKEISIIAKLDPHTQEFLFMQDGMDSIVLRNDLSGFPGIIRTFGPSSDEIELVTKLRVDYGEDPAIWGPIFDKTEVQYA